MRTEIIKNSNEHYIVSINCTKNFLNWSANADESYYLIVRSEFGKDFNIDDGFIHILNDNQQIVNGEVIDVTDSTSVMLFNKQVLLGYKCKNLPARYSIYVCDYIQEEQKLIIYIDDKPSFCDVPYLIEFRLEKQEEPKKKRLFFKKSKKQDDRTFIRILLKSENPVGYIDGALYYAFPNLKYKYPITKGMLKNGFIVPLYNDAFPMINSNSMGFEGKLTDEV